MAQSYLFVAPWAVACQAPLSMEFSRQECWSGLPFPTLGVFLTQGSNPRFSGLLLWQVDSGTEGGGGGKY